MWLVLSEKGMCSLPGSGAKPLAPESSTERLKKQRWRWLFLHLCRPFLVSVLRYYMLLNFYRPEFKSYFITYNGFNDRASEKQGITQTASRRSHGGKCVSQEHNPGNRRDL